MAAVAGVRARGDRDAARLSCSRRRIRYADSLRGARERSCRRPRLSHRLSGPCAPPARQQQPMTRDRWPLVLLSFVASFHLAAAHVPVPPLDRGAAAWVTIAAWRSRRWASGGLGRASAGRGTAFSAASVAWMLEELAVPARGTSICRFLDGSFAILADVRHGHRDPARASRHGD